MRKMTPEQSEFAEKNHNLVLSFLAAKKLAFEEYYDVVIFGFLEAAQQYLESAALAATYQFSTIAYRKMNDELCDHWTKENRQMRKADTISLDAPIPGTDNLYLAETVTADTKTPHEQTEITIAFLECFKAATPNQWAVVEARAAGYTGPEIAEMQGISPSGIYSRVARLRAKTREAVAIGG